MTSFLFYCPLCQWQMIYQIPFGEQVSAPACTNTKAMHEPGITMKRIYEPTHINYGSSSSRYDDITQYQLKNLT